MLKYLIIALLLTSTHSFGQGYTINNTQTDSLFIGMNNALKIEGFTRDDEITIQTSNKIRISNSYRSQQQFILHVSRPFQNDSVFVFNGTTIIDTIILSSSRTKLDQFVKTDSAGLIKSGAYTRDVLKQLHSVIVTINVPWIGNLKVQRFTIEISNSFKVVFSKTLYEPTIDAEIKKALSKLKRGDVIVIKNVMARTPYDDGERPKWFNFEVI